MSDETTEAPHVVVRTNGPLLVHGNLEVRTQSGDLIRQDKVIALCRCGASSDKPFCDGTHKKVGFTAD